MTPKIEDRAERCPFCGGHYLCDLGRVAGFAFKECPRCRLCFSPEIDEGVQERYRVRYAGFPVEQDPPECGWAYAAFLDPVWPLLDDEPLRILDFGAGDSVVPDALRERGHRVVGVDIAPPLRPHPDRITGPIGSVALPVSSFDLIYSFQVFEHLPQPRPVLDRLVDLLAPGGLLAIHTDMETTDRGDFLHWWYVTPPDHCTFYRNRTFAWYAREQGMSLVHADDKIVCMRRE